MNALDNELVPTLHRQASNLHIDTPVVLELIFHILDKWCPNVASNKSSTDNSFSRKKGKRRHENYYYNINLKSNKYYH